MLYRGYCFLFILYFLIIICICNTTCVCIYVCIFIFGIMHIKFSILSFILSYHTHFWPTFCQHSECFSYTQLVFCSTHFASLSTLPFVLQTNLCSLHLIIPQKLVSYLCLIRHHLSFLITPTIVTQKTHELLCLFS